MIIKVLVYGSVMTPAFVVTFANRDEADIIMKALSVANTDFEMLDPECVGKTLPYELLEVLMRGCDNNRIAQIKAIRMICNCGLKEAKDFVEEYMTPTVR